MTAAATETLTPEWLAECEGFDCMGNDPNPLLAAPGEWRRQGCVFMSGEIRDRRGHHSMATFRHGPHARDHGQSLTVTKDPLAALRLAARLLRPLGWSLFDVAVNEATGYVRIIAEARDWERREGTMVTLMRGSHDGVVREIRDRTVCKSGMYEPYWEVAWHLGRRRFDDLRAAALELLGYACDNGPSGALTESESMTRRELLGASIAALSA